MRAVQLVLAAQFRRQWRQWLALALLIALVSGFALAAAAAGRRAASAFPRFVADHGYDAIVYTNGPIPALAHFPEVASATLVLSPSTGPARCACFAPIGQDFAVLEVPPASLTRVVKLVAGRLPEQSAPDEVLASVTLAQDKGVRVGSVIRVPMYARAQQVALQSNPQLAPRGPRLAFRVVGIEVAENEFPSGQMTPYYIYTTRAFAAAESHRTLTSAVYYVRLRHGRAGLPGLDARLRRFPVFTVVHLDGGAAAAAASIRPQAVGWWVLAGLAALAGLAVIGQAIARQSAATRAEYSTLAALGMRPGEFVVLGLLRVLIAGAAGAVAGVVLAAALSPLAPLGEARLAESSTGVAFDPLILPLGALAAVTAAVVLGVGPAIRDARPLYAKDRVPGAGAVPVVRAVAAAGAPPSATIGVRYALQRGGDRHPVPVATALVGMIMAVGALCATAVFGASLSHLVTSPELYGDPYQLYFTQSAPDGAGILTGSLLPSLQNDPSVDRITLAAAPEIAVNHAHVRAIAVTAVRGRVLLSVVDGRLPDGDGQISLGATTMRETGAEIGSIVKVTVTGPSGVAYKVPFRVVGRTSFTSDFGTGGLGTGAALTVDGYLNAQCPAGQARPACRRSASRGLEYALFARAVPGPVGRAALTRYLGRYSSQAARPAIPTALVNFGVSVNFPLILSVMLSLFGAATLVHLLTVSVARRRKQAGILKALGFVRHQVAAVVCWQATTVAVIGIVAGIPLGVAAGQVVWRAFATNLGVVPVPVVPVWFLAGLAAGVLAAANMLAASPALISARSHPGELLRTQ